MESALEIGTHHVVQIDDLVEVQFRGALTRDDAVVLHERLRQIFAERGSCYLLADLGGISTMTPDARRFMGEWNKAHRISGVALYGGNFAIRALATLTANAIRLLGSHQTEVVFPRDEAEARRWIATHRAGQTST